jgi:hypothetical protein
MLDMSVLHCTNKLKCFVTLELYTEAQQMYEAGISQQSDNSFKIISLRTNHLRLKLYMLCLCF